MSLPFFRGESSLFCIGWRGGPGGEFSLQAILRSAALLHTGLDPCASPDGLCQCRLSAGWAADSKGSGRSILYTTSRKRHHRSLSFRTQWGLVQDKEFGLFFCLIILFNIFLSTKVIYRHHIKSRKSKMNIIKIFDNFTKHRYLLVPFL